MLPTMHFSLITPLQSFTIWIETHIKAAYDYRPELTGLKGTQKHNSVKYTSLFLWLKEKCPHPLFYLAQLKLRLLHKF